MHMTSCTISCHSCGIHVYAYQALLNTKTWTYVYMYTCTYMTLILLATPLTQGSYFSKKNWLPWVCSVIHVYISYCVGYQAIWQVIARVCEVLPEPKAKVILTHECNNSQYCPINHVISCLLPSSSSTWC